MAASKNIASISRRVSNRLDKFLIGERALAGVIGDSPSHYSKSPQLWNAAFAHLGMDAVYCPFDVGDAAVGDLLRALKEYEAFLGANVTVPHKLRVMEFLDSIDGNAERIHAVNTIVRTPDGKLAGFNTDGEGFLDSILKPQPDRPSPFVPSLAGRNVMLLGAGGAARAVAFHVAGELRGGKLLICNRTHEQAASLASEMQKAGRAAQAIREEELSRWLPEAGLVVNCTIKGQGGVRRLTNGAATFLDAYSALAPAHPPGFLPDGTDDATQKREWRQAALSDIQSNNEISMKLAQSVPMHAGFYDLIYYPEETVFLRHGRLSGHPTMNGKAMIINQAVIAFCKRICKAELQARALDTPETSREILEVMYRAW